MDRPAPEEYQPRLSAWGHVWRLVVVLGLSALGWLPIIDTQPELLWVLDVGLGLVAYVLVFFFRRRWPVPIALIANFLTFGSSIASGPAVLASISVATRRRWREIAPVASVGFAGAQVFAATQPSSTSDPFWLILAINVVATVAIFGWGMYIGSRRELMWTLRHRAETAESEQELRIAQARANERARIAREMHDVLAHRISQVSMHAGALAFREDLTPEQVHISASVIRDKAHEALTDLRGVLGVLRGADGEPALAPQPTYADLGQLVAEAREGGLNLKLYDRVSATGEIPDAAGRTLYRIVQEGITNARKHAPGSLLTVELTGSPEDGLDVVMRNPLGFGSAMPGSGLGLVGLTERAELRGGRLDVRREDDKFVLHAWIPWGSMIRVLIVDDDPLVRSALVLMLGGQPDLEVVGEAGDGRAGLRLVDELRPAVVLMDIRMPRMSGLEATRALQQRPDPPHVIVLTTFDADEHVVGALAAGADGFLLKDTPPPQILEAIRAVADGDPMLSPSVTRTLIERIRDDSGDDRGEVARLRLGVLTEREHEVALAVGRGLTNAEIARALHLSVPTVKAHVSRLFDKLQVTNRVQIAICVHDAGLV